MSRRSWGWFALVSLLWGLPYLLVKLSVAEISAVELAFARTAIATAVLLPLAIARHAFAGLWRRAGLLVAIAVTEICLPFVLIGTAEQHIPSSLAGLMVAAEPLFVALWALRFDRSERVSGARLAGLLVGVTGLALLLGLDLGAGLPELAGSALVLGASASYGGGALIMKRAGLGASSLGVMTASLAIASVILAPLTLLQGGLVVPGPEVAAYVVVLGVGCTGVGFAVFSALISAAGASRATVVSYVSPAIAVLLGVVVLGEPVSFAMAAGFLLVIAGSWMSATGRPPKGLLAGVSVLRHLLAGPSGLGRARLARQGRLAACLPAGTVPTVPAAGLGAARAAPV